MTYNETRRILIVDDQQQIHDTFKRLFSPKEQVDDALSDFESRFLKPSIDSSDAKPNCAESPNPVGYQLTHAHSGDEGIALVTASIAQDNRFSVAFVDMRMPAGMDGLQTIEAIWEIDANLQVVVCTAYSDHSWDHVLDRLGRNDRLLLLRKPFETDEARQLALALSEKSRLEKIQRRELEKLEHEVVKRRSAEREMRAMAHRDALTQLPNRPYLLKKLDEIIQQRSVGDCVDNAVLFLDLDNFKIINDSLGHNAGDDLLNQVATRLKECVRDCDTTGRYSDEETIRLGGDEFVVLLEKLADDRDAIMIANRIVEKISEPFHLCGRLVTVGTSVGIAYTCGQTTDAHIVLRNADTAMYRAKNSGKGRIAVFDRSMHADVVARMELENQLRRAVDLEAFELNYQPIVRLSDARIQGIEVLMRWKNEQGVYISPCDFIPMTEEIGLIGKVGEWVLEHSMIAFTKVISQLPAGSHDDLYMSVNTSRRQLNDPFFLERLNQILARTQFCRQRLKLEVNESYDPRHRELALQTLLNLHQSGVGIHIDDFGKGQSSLTCFQSYPIETVKIDRSFTASIATDRGHAAITQAIVQLSHNLGAKIVAEGVESKQQLDALREWGCDAVQGYYFSAPLTETQLFELLANPMQCEGIRSLRQQLAAPVIFSQPFNRMLTNETSV
ncbi:EAL domain-containing protein [Rubripirellula reticaptiva]|uniref:Phytochrome-like protein cph2 n=1 Tax=Rubripirellula reticaptiva TaxID=2528013 RepID=A0A5C6FF26_9BACT|nr:EAL domain-containing protein [Rubripirellula reticaptiva]TWU58229.1 Phytochrome-like protein cph2 [Rubripirellula reticaptiva]